MLQPKLRFKNFTEKWEEKSLNSIFERINEKNTENNRNVLTISAQYGLISQTDFFNKSVAGKDLTKYYLLHKNDFAYNKSYSNGYPMGAIKKLSKYDKGIVSTLYICFRVKTNDNINFLEQFFESKKMEKNIQDIAQEGARNHGLLNINVKDFFNINIKIPNIKEQEKIAGFLSSVDVKLDLTEQKLELLKKYKKSVMKKIFNQEIRFKDKNGNNYPEWNLVTTREISKITMGFTPNTRDESMWNGEYKWLSIADLKENGKYIYKTAKTITNKGIKNKKILKKGTLVMSFKLTLGKLGIISEEMFTNEAICHFNWTDKYLINTEYIYYYLNSIDISNFGKQAVKGITLNTESLNSIEIELPCLEEQQKIADFLSSIDDKIEKISNELENLKEFKKGLLQQMFV